MRIIVDWCDWTWKTTLVNELLKQLPDYRVVKFSQPKTDNPFEEWIWYYQPWHKNYIWDNVILDRCRMSEVIYWKVLKRKNQLTKAQINEFLYLTQWFVYIVSHCYLETIQQVFNTRWEDFIDINQASRVNYLYKKLYTLYWWENRLLYNFKKDWKNLQKYVKKILKKNNF